MIQFSPALLQWFTLAERPMGIIITELVFAFLLLVALFLFRGRFMKILCACGSEVLLFMACKAAFGSDAIITQILCWVTAAAICALTVSIVNRIDWKSLRGGPGR